MTATSTTTARLLKVVVQVVLVAENEDGLAEVACEPVTVQGNAWRQFAEAGFDLSVAALIARIEGPPRDAA